MKGLIIVIGLCIAGASAAVAQPTTKPPHRKAAPRKATPQAPVRAASPETLRRIAPPRPAPPPPPSAAPRWADPVVLPPEKPPAPAPPGLSLGAHTKRNFGLLVSLSGGGSGCTAPGAGGYISSQDCMGGYGPRVKPMAYGQTHVLLRMKRFFAVGVHFSAQFFKPVFEGSGKARVIQIHVAPELRGLVPLGKAELWAALTFGYFRHMIEAPHWETRLQEFDWYHGFAFGWGFGAHYYVVPNLALGVAMWFHKPAITRHCHISGLENRSCERVELIYQQWVGFTWSMGATLSFWWGR